MLTTRPLDGAGLRERRKALRLTMKQMGERLYCSESCISRWEAGKAQPYSWKAIDRLLGLIEDEEKAKAPIGV